MLQSYLPIYQIALDLEALLAPCELLRYSNREVSQSDTDHFRTLLEAIMRECPNHGCVHTADLAARILRRPLPKSEVELISALNHLNDSLTGELEKEAIFRIPQERKTYYEQNNLFGEKVSTAFPSCDRDIQKAGSCYALAQEDACVHHLMLVLERGLNALAAKVGVSFHYADWQKLIDQIEAKLKSGMPRGPELDFYRHVNAQFGFLKEAYRKHSAHARDDPYDMPKALSNFNHVKEFMQEIEKGGLSE